MNIMEWTKAQEIKVWLFPKKHPPRMPDISLKNPEYRIMDSGVMIKGIEEGEIHFFPHHRINQITIKP